MSELNTEIREMLVDVLSLEDIKPEEIGLDDNLFDEDGLALDSIDALELGVEIQKRYGIKMDNQDEKLAEHFKNIRSLVSLIESHKAGAAS